MIFIRILILLIVLMTSSNAMASWDGNPYIEFRYTLLSNEPSVIGAQDCPCYGSELIAGFETTPFGINRWLLDINAKTVFQTRWDDPEIYQFNMSSDWQWTRRFHWLIGYRQTHNLDRPTPNPTQYMDWRGLHNREPGGLGWGWSGVHYLWTGVRWSFR